MIRSTVMKYLLLLICLPQLLVGCLSSASPDPSSLLRQDYLRMSDAELIAYEQALSDALVRSSRSSQGDVSVGIGFGSWGGGSGYGVHADRWLGGGGSDGTTGELINRRDKVRNEMRRRRLLPP